MEQKKVILEQYEVEYVLCAINDALERLRRDPEPDEFVPQCINEYIQLGKKIQEQTSIYFVEIK